MTEPKDIKLYATHPHPCSYFSEREARTIFIDPELAPSPAIYSALSRRGFRRSGNHIYRPDCSSCQDCIASRVPVGLFTPNRQQRRVLNRNNDVVVKISAVLSEQAYPLYERYINIRHQDGDMYPPSQEQFDNFLSKSNASTEYIHFYDDDVLIAVAVTDVLDDGLSAIYTFYDPEQTRRSLGVFGILWQINYAKSLNLPYVYLGYWIKDCQKMRYKTDYRPIELLMNNRWVLLN
ncbi:Aspartate/glutamate leucyltransferase [Zhongshania aliphaticivorans]|uniref:Aspartate/glutamate leucyltransferase n=1 Tax=Zhongshania aliphaticivorans TaxID=1470434 RepID=A0A5S9NGI4_9GAMM|nr:arginyltransferase [Zhongshania aliphaticivorans]CAA0088792.1 Aspartate/glutamate leucyltransferase [Zhongshania aliphaticivorans]CAA0095159.1 Aspartate/glutamate leucyltransferase [Zhongshania aliphaticivorans]